MSEMTNQCNPEPRSLGLMEDLAEMLRDEVLPTHPTVIQLIDKVCKDPTLKQVDLYSKYIRLAAVVGGDWINVKEELRNATFYGAPAFYCSISAMLAVFTCRRSRSHDELVSSLTELYNNISAGNGALNKQFESAITTMEKQIEHANKAEVSFTNLNEQAENAVNTIRKQVEQVNKAEESIANIIERADNAINTIGNQIKQNNVSESTPPQSASKYPKEEVIKDKVDAVLIPGTTYRCKYGTLTIDDQYQCGFSGDSLEAKKLSAWFTLPLDIWDLKKLLNYNHKDLISLTEDSVQHMHECVYMYKTCQKRSSIYTILEPDGMVKHKAGQWSYIC